MAKPWPIAPGIQELPDRLGDEFPPEQIRESTGVQVAFAAGRVGEEFVIVADVQNNLTAVRRVALVVTPDARRRFAHSGIKEAETEMELAGGEVGRFELTIPIPPGARAKEKFHLSIRVRGTGGQRCRSVQRKALGTRIPPLLTALMVAVMLVAGGVALGGGGLSVTLDGSDRGGARTPAPARARCTSRFRPNPPLIVSASTRTPEEQARNARNNRIAITMAAAVALSFLGYGAWHFTHPDVFIVNAFDTRLNLSVGNTSSTIPPHSVMKTHFGIGTTLVRAHDPSGSEVDVESIDASFPSRVVVWNIAGAAPVFEREIDYLPAGAPDPATKPRAQLFCGRPVLRFSSIDFAFQDPPRSIETDSSYSNETRKTWLGVRSMEDAGTRCLGSSEQPGPPR